MKNLFKLTFVAFALVAFTACNEGTTTETEAVETTETEVVEETPAVEEEEVVVEEETTTDSLTVVE